MSKRQIIEYAVADMISEKVIAVGERIPSIRKMAQLYDMSATPVIEAYRNLECCGIVESRHKSCYVVASDDVSLLPGYLSREPSEVCETDAANEEDEACAVCEDCDDRIGYDFGKMAFMCPAPDREMLAQCIAKTLKNNPYILDVDPCGCDNEELVDALSAYMLHYRFIVSKKEISIVNNDISTAFILAIQSCSNPDQTILLTSPCAEVHRYSVNIARRRCIYIPSSFQRCVELDVLEHVVSQNDNIAGIIVAPNYMTPNGALMSDEDKRRLVDICVEHNIAIIEDDSCGDLYFSGQCPRTLKSMAAEQTIYVSTFTTSVAPGIPVHWVCPGKYSESFRYFRNKISSTLPVFLQGSFAQYMRSRYFKKHMACVREQMYKAVEAARHAAGSSFPEGTRINNPQGGFWLCVELPSAVPAEKLAERAGQKGISFYVNESDDGYGRNNCIAINCSVIAREPDKIAGICELGRIAAELAAE